MALVLRRPEAFIIHRYRNKSSLQIQILKSAFVSTLVVAALFAIVTFGPSNKQISEDNEQPGILGRSQTTKNASSKSSRIIILEGDASSYLDFSVNDVLLQTENKPVDYLILKYVTFNSEIFTKMLQTNPKIFQTLKSLKFERVKIQGISSYFLGGNTSSSWDNFTLRVMLPMLSDFQLDLDIGFHIQYTDYMPLISEEWLMGVLFYDKKTPHTTNLADKLVTDEVQVTLRVDGWTVLSYQKSSKVTDAWEVILGLTFGDKLLHTLNKNRLKIVHLTMTECVVSAASFPSSLQYLNLYRVNISGGGGDIHTFFQTVSTSLTDLYIELRNSTLILSQIPKTVKTLSIGDVTDARYDDAQDYYSVAAENVGLSFPLDDKIVENFDTIFPHVRRIAAFEPPSSKVGYTLLKNILKTNNASWILMQGFERRNATEFENEEQVLRNFGVSLGQRNFLLFRDERAPFSWTGMDLDLDKLRTLRFRYEILGWNEYISWDVFSTKLL